MFASTFHMRAPYRHLSVAALLMLAFALTACPDDTAPTTAAPPSVPASASGESAKGAASEPACADWPHQEPCNGAIQLLREYAAFGSWDRRRFAENPAKMAELEEETWQTVRRFYTAELYADVSQARELVKDADERGALLRTVRSDMRIVSALPIDRELWSETAAHLRVEVQSEWEFITGEVACILEEYWMGMLRESPTESWRFDRGVFIPVESQTTLGICRS